MKLISRLRQDHALSIAQAHSLRSGLDGMLGSCFFWERRMHVCECVSSSFTSNHVAVLKVAECRRSSVPFAAECTIVLTRT
jgi:hypothetical protein